MTPCYALIAAALAALVVAVPACAQQAGAPDANIAGSARVSASSEFSNTYIAARATDGKFSNESRWLSKNGPGPHVLTLEWPAKRRIGAIQLGSGWYNEGAWEDAVKNFVFEYRDGQKWSAIPGTRHTENGAVEVNMKLAAPVETDAIRLVISDPGTVRVVEVRAYEPAASYPVLALPINPADRASVVSVPPVFVNQSGYGTNAPKRFTAPTLSDGTPFAVRPAAGVGAVFQGTIRGNIGDFSAFRPAGSATEYVVEAGGLKSDPFRVAPLWLERVSLDPALHFMVDCRSLVGTHPSAYGGSAWRDGTYYSYEVPSLVMLYLSNPAYFDNAPVEMRYADDKARLLAPDFKPVAANGDKGALEAARRYYTEIDAPVGERVPDIFQLIHWGIGWHLVKPESADPSGDPIGWRVHPQAVEQFAFFLYGYPHFKQHFSDGFYRRARDFAFAQWEKVGLFGVFTTVGDYKGREAPGHSVLPNLLMYEVAKRDNRPDADRFLSAAVAQAKWIVDSLDAADPKVTKGQRMSEHMTVTGLTALLRDYPEKAPAGLKAWLTRWADTAIARSDNLWDFRRYDEKDWTLPRFTPGSHGGAGWNEPGNVAAFPACALAVADLMDDTSKATRLREIAWAHWDDLYGRNPLGAHSAYRGPQDFAGVERGWPKKFPDNVCARLELVRGTISSTAATEHYPYNPTGAFRHPEGWTAFNAAYNVGLAYTIRETAKLSVTRTAEGLAVELIAPVAGAADKAGPAKVTLTAPGGDVETVTVTPTAGDETVLRGTIRTAAGKAAPGDGTLQLGAGEAATATYGFGRYATTATAATSAASR